MRTRPILLYDTPHSGEVKQNGPCRNRFAPISLRGWHTICVPVSGPPRKKGHPTPPDGPKGSHNSHHKKDLLNFAAQLPCFQGVGCIRSTRLPKRMVHKPRPGPSEEGAGSRRHLPWGRPWKATPRLRGVAPPALGFPTRPPLPRCPSNATRPSPNPVRHALPQASPRDSMGAAALKTRLRLARPALAGPSDLAGRQQGPGDVEVCTSAHNRRPPAARVLHQARKPVDCY